MYAGMITWLCVCVCVARDVWCMIDLFFRFDLLELIDNGLGLVVGYGGG